MGGFPQGSVHLDFLQEFLAFGVRAWSEDASQPIERGGGRFSEKWFLV